MPRANRYYTPGHVWHLTHRCHDQDHLLKFSKDRDAWVGWLFEAKKRFGLSVLDYTVTCNHTHLLVYDSGPRDTIPKSMQLIAGRVAQEYNERKNRNGPFWEDRYHATAVESTTHLARCIAYIDLNMIRARAVTHPGEWVHCGFHEIQTPRDRYRIVDRERIAVLMGLESVENLAGTHRRIVDEALAGSGLTRDDRWTRSVAVGSQSFVEKMKGELGARARYRSSDADVDGLNTLRELPSLGYGDSLTRSSDAPGELTAEFWDAQGD